MTYACDEMVEALKRVTAERDALREMAAEMEQAINESVSGLRQRSVLEWTALLGRAQRVLGGQG